MPRYPSSFQVSFAGAALPARSSATVAEDHNQRSDTDCECATLSAQPVIPKSGFESNHAGSLTKMVSNIPNYPQPCITCYLERRLSSGIEEYLHRLVGI